MEWHCESCDKAYDNEDIQERRDINGKLEGYFCEVCGCACLKIEGDDDGSDA